MRRLLCGLIALLAGTLAAADASAQQGETRIALIIANEEYVSPNLGRLPGTQRDAEIMQVALQHAGFEVTVARNLTRLQMRAELSAFERLLALAGRRGVGFFYYSGHGVADHRRGANYLIPVDAQIGGVTDLPTWGISLNDELDAIEAAAAKASFIVIDACRNTPVSLNRAVDRGLIATHAVTRTLVAFSTQPGAVAADDNIYARNLADALLTPGATSDSVFSRVQSAVARATGEGQVPRFDSGLVEPIVFVGTDSLALASSTILPPASSTPPLTAPTTQSRARSADGGAYQDFAVSIGPARAAALDAVQSVGLDLRGTEETRDGFLIRFSTQYNFVTAGENGTILVSRIDDRNTRITVTSRGRSLSARLGGPQSGGVSEQQYADRLFFNISRYLANLQ